MKKYISIILATTLLFVIFSCSGDKTVEKKKSQEELAKERQQDSLALKVGVEQTIDCLPAFVAKDEGIFDSLGVDVRLRHYTSMLDCNRSLLRGEIQGAFTDTKRMDYLLKNNSFASKSVMPTSIQWKLVANHKSRLFKLSQFIDKMIAMTRHSATDYLCDRMVDSIKLSSERIYRIQINNVDLRLKMLLNNEIDAAWLPEPQASVAIAHGNNVLMQSGRKGEQLGTLSFSEKALSDKRRKQQVDTFVKAYEIAKDKIEKGGSRYYSDLIARYYKYNIK